MISSVDRFLVPDTPPAAPAGAVVVTQALIRSVPAEVRLDAELSLVLFVPVGDAHLWRDADSSLVACAGSDESAAANPLTQPPEPTARPPARLLLQRGGSFIAAVPLVLGVRRQIPDDGTRASLIDLTVLDYGIHAGTLRQAGDFGSFIRFAWRRIDDGTDEFRLPPLPPRVAERFAGQVQSDVGLDES